MLNSPNKQTSLDKLKRIKTDNYIGANGVEYCSSEVDMMIFEKMNKKATELVKQAKAYDFSRPIEEVVKNKTIRFKEIYLNDIGYDFYLTNDFYNNLIN